MCAQSTYSSPPWASVNPSHQFDVVSIRRSKDDESWSIGQNENGYRAIGLPLWMTIRKAYLPSAIQDRNLLSGAPSWVWNEKYDLVAKIPVVDLELWNQEWHSNSSTNGTLLEEMLQNALRVRCGLKVHRVPAETQGYALTLKKHGPNPKLLKLSSHSESIPASASKVPQGGGITGGENSSLNFWQTPMAALAAQLTILLTLPVEDKTGLLGKYDFPLNRIDIDGQSNESSGAPLARHSSSPQWDIGALGFELTPITIHSEAVVIDQIHRPSDN